MSSYTSQFILSHPLIWFYTILLDVIVCTLDGDNLHCRGIIEKELFIQSSKQEHIHYNPSLSAILSWWFYNSLTLGCFHYMPVTIPGIQVFELLCYVNILHSYFKCHGYNASTKSRCYLNSIIVKGENKEKTISYQFGSIRLILKMLDQRLKMKVFFDKEWMKDKNKGEW